MSYPEENTGNGRQEEPGKDQVDPEVERRRRRERDAVQLVVLQRLQTEKGVSR